MPASAQATPGPRPQTRRAATTRPPRNVFNGDIPRRIAMPPPPGPGPYPAFPSMYGMPVPLPLANTVPQHASGVMKQAITATRAMRKLFQSQRSAWTALQALYNHAFISYHVAHQLHETYRFLPQLACVARGVNQLQDGTAVTSSLTGTLPNWDTHFAAILTNSLSTILPCLCNITAECIGAFSGLRSQFVIASAGSTFHWDSAYIGQKLQVLRDCLNKITGCLVFCKFIHLVRLETLHGDYSRGFTDGDDGSWEFALKSYRTAADGMDLFWNCRDIHYNLKRVREVHSLWGGSHRGSFRGKKNQKEKSRIKVPKSTNADNGAESRSKSNTTQSASIQDLFAAMARSDYGTVKTLINAGIDLNAMLQDGTFVLSHAVDRNNGALVSLLCLCGADPNVRHRSGNTPLHFASNINCLAPALILLEMGAEVDARDAQGLTPLHVACRERHLSVIIHLLAYGADPNAYDNNGITPLGYSILHPQKINFRVDILDALLTYGALATSPGHTLSPLVQAVIRKNRDDLKAFAEEGMFLVESETVVATTGDKHGGLVKLRPLYFALLCTQCFCVDELITLGADIHHQVRIYGEPISYLFVAIHSQTPALVDRVLAHGADPNGADRHGITPLQTAVNRTKCNAEIVGLLIRHGANCSAKTYTHHIQPLHTAAFYSRADICVPLIENGADVNEPVKNGISPFMLAIYGGSKSTARCLMGKGAETQYHTPRFGETAMHSACRVGNLLLAAFLLEEGLSVDATYQFPVASTDSADSADLASSPKDASTESDDGASMVIERSCRGFAPIHIAAARGHLKMVQWLLKNGADAEARIGRTALRVCLSGKEIPRGYNRMRAYCSAVDDNDEAGGDNANGDELDLGQTAAQVGRLFGHEPVAFCIEDHITQQSVEAMLHQEPHQEASSSSEGSSTQSPSVPNPSTANQVDSVQPSPSI